ncbi:hypothetical protein EIY87_24305 [Amycolatopsis eburnea]|uniref:GerMN domain-containing protein n=1 Tax=Amycolatopsis eburnea TaxID=2267691 RepID=A0A3R9DI32_9PSEU|nr:hypothetical protein EIY87_24305 [Amycolatopsis eburnea]
MVKKVLVLAVLLLVSACGVKPTPVIGAGPAPTLRNPEGDAPGTEVTLYFVLDGRLTPVARPVTSSMGVNTTLSLLLGGPSRAEAADGYTTMLPAAGGEIALSPDPPPTITLPFPVQQLTPIAVNQLVCTTFAALAAQSRYVIENAVVLAGTDTKLPPQTCQAF